MARILYFGIARDLAGCDAEELDLGEGSSVAQLWEELVARHAGLERIRGIARLAVDMQYADADARVGAGSEVAIIPPVAGG